ncbi:MAG: MATE family efflux transporter [Lachnospiraceae bacterium]|uniref:Probable multidrug resistance protein NorM n=1 Tax=Hominiventricola filiformis TaxID=2885352 RepID=A0AAE3A4F6_9FIRM|nr:MATE family efflux transporter [Hominiventricola filiformis]MCC2124722.1 MATE family efflux transporter [Hominiventricola filiformis]MCI6881106.1 MATE family efflux transporter [Clostridiaceae bacterium]MDY3826375.1 MATE family efflux transporter [Lachnospiraceae bacterium]
MKAKEMDMLHGGLAGKLILFAIPLAFSSILQQLFNSADVAVVGRFAGSAALAAVGSCVALVGIFVNLIVGLSVGPNAALANLIGQGQRERISGMVHTILTFGIALGVVLMGLGFLTARTVLEASGTPESVINEALLYIRIYFIGVPFMTIYNFGAAILRSYGDTKRPMCYLIISGTVNVVLNLIFVIGFGLGVEGVAISTSVSNMLSTAMVLTHLYRKEDEFQFRFHKMCVLWKDLKRILMIGIPAGIQGAIFSVSNVFIQSGINTFGEDAIAGSSLALNFEYFTYDIGSAFAQAAVTFTSQNFGAGNLKRCKKIFWLCLIFGVGFTEILSIIFMIWDDFFVSIYTISDAVAVYGLIRMHHVCSMEGLTATYEVESAALRGLEKSLEPSIITILGTVVFRMIWMATVFKWIPTYEMLMNVYISSWVFTGGLIFIVYVLHMRKLEKEFAEKAA